MGFKPRLEPVCPNCGSADIDLIRAFGNETLYGCRSCLTGFISDGTTTRVIPRPSWWTQGTS